MRRPGRPKSAFDKGPERVPFQQLHGDEGLAFKLIYVMNGADVGVIERGSGLSFAAETLQGLMIFRHSLGQEFKRYETVQPRVLGLIDDTHATATELLDDAVVRDGRADHWS